MTRGERRILDELTGEYFDKFVSVNRLAKVLGYTTKFVDRTIDALYWKSTKRLFFVRRRKGKTWFYRASGESAVDRLRPPS